MPGSQGWDREADANRAVHVDTESHSASRGDSAGPRRATVCLVSLPVQEPSTRTGCAGTSQGLARPALRTREPAAGRTGRHARPAARAQAPIRIQPQVRLRAGLCPPDRLSQRGIRLTGGLARVFWLTASRSGGED